MTIKLFLCVVIQIRGHKYNRTMTGSTYNFTEESRLVDVKFSESTQNSPYIMISTHFPGRISSETKYSCPGGEWFKLLQRSNMMVPVFDNWLSLETRIHYQNTLQTSDSDGTAPTY